MSHTCHHPTCSRVTDPKMLACRTHWFLLPQELRIAIWRTYRPGQEEDKQPSQEYMDVLAQVMQYWRDREQQQEGTQA